MLLKTLSGLYLTGFAQQPGAGSSSAARAWVGRLPPYVGHVGSVICNESYRKHLPVPGFPFRYWELWQGQLRFKYSSLFI